MLKPLRLTSDDGCGVELSWPHCLNKPRLLGFFMLFTLILAGCIPQTAEVDDGTYGWAGFVYADIPADGGSGLTIGSIEVHDLDNERVSSGEQSDEQNPANWRIPLSESEPVSIRISGPDQLTTVWRTTTPAAPSFWFAGSFFAVKSSTILPLWESLSELVGAPLATTEGAHLYGEALPLSDDDIEAWTGAEITVIDGDGTAHAAIALSTTAEGFLVPATEETGPVTAFTATDLAPGEVQLQIEASDGRSVVTDYFAEPGDLLSAFAFTLPETR